MLVLTIKTKKEESAFKPVTLASLLLPFKKIKSLNTKILYNSFLFKNKVPKIKKENLESDKSIFLKNVYIISSL